MRTTLIIYKRTSIVFSRAVNLRRILQHTPRNEDTKSAMPGQDNGSELKFLAVLEQSCHSPCHLKQRWQMRQ